MPGQCEDWQKHRKALQRWRVAYTDYLASDYGERTRLRDAVDAAIPDADVALEAVQCDVAAPDILDAGVGGEVHHGLAAVMRWLHDREKAPPARQPTVVLEVVDRALKDIYAHERNTR